MNKKRTLSIGYLYGDIMNIYGDTGNIIALQYRCAARHIETQVHMISLENSLTQKQCDLFFFGGGQDASQIAVSKDIQKKSDVIAQEIKRGVPLLAICGGYQLLGEYYEYKSESKDLRAEGERDENLHSKKLLGLGIFPAYTVASATRMIGNILIDSSFGSLVGFENHSGKTYVKEQEIILGKVVQGYGNNGEDKTEGCRIDNAVGCYMHGPLLPKNPTFTDWLIETALSVKYQDTIKLDRLDNEFENNARTSLLKTVFKKNGSLGLL